MEHDDLCARSGDWYAAKECREFSTDGTALGAVIAHSMGTTDQDEIIQKGIDDLRNMSKESLTGMDEEQADWDADE